MPFAYVMPLSVLPFCVMPFRHRDAFLRDVYLIIPLSEFLSFTMALFCTGFDIVYVMFDLSLFTHFRVFNFVVDIMVFAFVVDFCRSFKTKA